MSRGYFKDQLTKWLNPDIQDKKLAEKVRRRNERKARKEASRTKERSETEQKARELSKDIKPRVHVNQTSEVMIRRERKRREEIAYGYYLWRNTQGE